MGVIPADQGKRMCVIASLKVGGVEVERWSPEAALRKVKRRPVGSERGGRMERDPDCRGKEGYARRTKPGHKDRPKRPVRIAGGKGSNR